MRLLRLIPAAVLLTALQAGAAIDFRSTNEYRLAGNELQEGQLWLAAVTTEVRGAVSDDFHALAQTALLGGTFSGSVWCAAETADFSGTAQGHARLLAAQQVTVRGRIMRSAMSASGTSIYITPEGVVDGDAVLASKRIVVEGKIGGAAQLIGDEITLAGTIEGPLRIIGSDIAVMPSAVLRGDIVYSSSKELFLDPRVKHEGLLVRKPLTQPASSSSAMPWALRLQLRVVQFMGALLVAWVWLRLAPLALSRAAHQLSVAPWRCFFTGLAVCFLMLPVILLLAISLIGIPLALLGTGIFAILLYVSRIVTAVLLGRIVLRSRGGKTPASPLLIITAGLLCLYILTLVPKISGGIWIVAVCAGLGALVLNVAAGSIIYVQPPGAKPPQEISQTNTDSSKTE
ncbi:MAG TPA: polymer-forming cytoskeletal protein [Kiritimatiellia bacterium]|nr:polymer-forming cytoskeletal protein [Kiritimatiellia bacterium]